MASNHLTIEIEFMDTLRTGNLKKQQFIMYSPSTIAMLRNEIIHQHIINQNDIIIYHNGNIMTDNMRIIDQYLYHVKLSSSTKSLAASYSPFLYTSPKDVTVDDGVYVDDCVKVDSSSISDTSNIYFAFAWKGIIRLLDFYHNTVISPNTLIRLGHCIIYSDWGRIRPLMLNVPHVNQNTWLYDRLLRDYGVAGSSPLFGIHIATLSQLQSYQTSVQEWLEKQSSSEESDSDDELCDDDKSELDNVLDNIETYMDDSEFWR